MKTPATLEPSRAELLLLVAGPTMLPDKDVIRASKTVWGQMCDALEEAIGLEEPDHLYKMGVSDSYAAKLQRFDPDYGPVIEALHPDGAAFQALQEAAKQALGKRRPYAEVMTVLGPQPVDVEPDGIDQRTWLMLCDTLEDPRRLVRDLAAGALCYEQVQLFADVFPETYGGLVQVAQLVFPKRQAADKTWLPPLWLADALHVFFQEPLGTGMTIAEYAPKPLAPQRKGKLDMSALRDALKGPNEAAL